MTYLDTLDNPAVSRGRKLLEVYWENPGQLSDEMYRIVGDLESAQGPVERTLVAEALIHRSENAHELRVEKIREIQLAIDESEGMG